VADSFVESESQNCILNTRLIPDFDALKQETTAEQADVLPKRLIASGVIERRTPGGHVILRFNLNPAAEYLPALRRLVDMRTKRAGPEEWNSFSQLSGGPRATPANRRDI
jgi:hypothetical protein